MKSVEQGPAPTVLAAVGKEWEAKVASTSRITRLRCRKPLFPGVMSVKDYTYDEAKDNELWELILKTLYLS
jgi:hypothetical protein